MNTHLLGLFSAPTNYLPPSFSTLMDGSSWVGGQLLLSTYYAIADGQQNLVTGGGTGLGLITAGALAENGAKVYITGRRLEPLQEAAKIAAPKGGKGTIIPLQADMSMKEDIDSK